MSITFWGTSVDVMMFMVRWPIRGSWIEDMPLPARHGRGPCIGRLARSGLAGAAMHASSDATRDSARPIGLKVMQAPAGREASRHLRSPAVDDVGLES